MSGLHRARLPIENGAVASYGLRKRVSAVENCRRISKKSMKWNGETPKMKVDPETYEVTADGVIMDVQPAEALPLTRNYNLF